MASYPKDQFDKLPEDLRRIGAHRAPKKGGRGWIGFAWAVLATGVLVFGGLFALSEFLGVDIGLPIFAAEETPTPTPTPTPTAEPVADPTTIDPARAITVTILNGTPTVGLEGTVAASLTAAAWPIKSAGLASEKDIDETFVYYSDPLNEDVARGLAIALGVGKIRLISPDIFPATPITIVLGTDYPVPTPAA
jgi:hypothetical protein